MSRLSNPNSKFPLALAVIVDRLHILQKSYQIPHDYPLSISSSGSLGVIGFFFGVFAIAFAFLGATFWFVVTGGRVTLVSATEPDPISQIRTAPECPTFKSLRRFPATLVPCNFEDHHGVFGNPPSQRRGTAFTREQHLEHCLAAPLN